MLRLIALAVALALAPTRPAWGWGFFAHETTAEIALANLAPPTRTKLQRLFAAERLVGTPGCALSSLRAASTWPDCIRRERWRWGHTAAWHYRTAPICEPFDPRANCADGNCVTAQITRNQRILADESLPDNVRLEALAFMVHFAGDVHMPLHSGDREDRGGNDREAAYGVVPGLNLHWIWDGPLAERAISSADPPLVRRYSAAERAELAGGDPDQWGYESWELARRFVYFQAFDRDPCEAALPARAALGQEDIGAALPIANRRIVQAGLRIADLIEAALAPGPLPPPG
jgi:hypothetical protein